MISRRERAMAALGVILLLAGTFLVHRSHGGMRDMRIAGAAVRILQPTQLPQVGAAVVFHGLSANRIIMQYLGQWLAAQGLCVYLVDASGHGDTAGHFSNAETLDSSIRVLSELLRTRQINPANSILVGHSMGGEIAIRLADYFPAAATIALSPAPMILPRQLPSNLLVIGAQFDLPEMKAMASNLLRVTNGPRTSLKDFQAHRAAQKIVAPWTSHGSLIMNSTAVYATARWARAALGSADPPNRLTGAPVAGEELGIVGLIMLFPITGSVVLGLVRGKRAPANSSRTTATAFGFTRSLLYWAIAGVIGVMTVSFWDPQRILPLYTGGYLGFFLLMTGGVLLFFFKSQLDIARVKSPGPLAASLILAALVILGFGAWLHWQLSDVWMHGRHSLYMVPLLFMALPYFLAEEFALGPAGFTRLARRWTRYVLLRLILWLTLMFGILVLFSGQVLLALLLPYLLIGSLGQRLGADWLRHHTGSPEAAALFSAILAAWFMAAVFPLA